MTGSAQSPVTRLIMFMVCLSLFGSILAGVHYYAVDLSAQHAPGVPHNSKQDCWGMYSACRNGCDRDYGSDLVHKYLCYNTCEDARDACELLPP